MKQIKFALIGCGRIAQRHAEQIHRVGELTAVCDIIKTRAEHLADKYSATMYTEIDELLANESGNIDVVVICTPNGLHAIHSVKALEAGFHVICEKPMALSVLDCKRMMKASHAAGRQLLIIKQNRYNPPVAAVKKLIEDGELGKILSVQINCFWNRDRDYYADVWHGTRDMDGGTLFTQFSHFIDIAWWMFGDVKRSMAITGNLNHAGVIEIEDTGVVVFEFESGVLGTLNYTVNARDKNMEGSVTIFAEKATIKIGGEYLNTLEYVEGVDLPDLASGSGANDYGGYKGSMSNHDKVYDDVKESWLNNSTIPDNANDGLQSVQIIEKIYASARKEHDTY